MYFVHVLYSALHDTIYIGYSSDIEARLRAHNHPQNKAYTKRYQPWELVFSEQFETRAQAMAREKALKSARGRAYIWEQVNRRADRKHDS
ncbi:MAG: GIY-YIG nuclease family protein [Bacteroidota bacterium]